MHFSSPFLFYTMKTGFLLHARKDVSILIFLAHLHVLSELSLYARSVFSNLLFAYVVLQVTYGRKYVTYAYLIYVVVTNYYIVGTRHYLVAIRKYLEGTRFYSSLIRLTLKLVCTFRWSCGWPQLHACVLP